MKSAPIVPGKPTKLNCTGAGRRAAIPVRTLGIAFQLNEDIDSVSLDAPRGLLIRHLADIDEVVEGPLSRLSSSLRSSGPCE
jgi:hypothetical protein